MFRLAQTPIKLCIQISVDMISCNLLYLRGEGGNQDFLIYDVAYDSISLSLYKDFWFLEIQFSRSSLCTNVMLEGGGERRAICEEYVIFVR